ncbi:mating pair formation protein [Paraburkholderia sediminicola]|uniref:mating pair formation protein n=1 Tax=Paraburkholderia sediminicola TaxID=458836 RepID=UPI0038B8BA22
MADAVVGKSVAKPLLSFIRAKTRDARAVFCSVDASTSRRMSLLVALLCVAVFPEFAYAMDYSTGTGLVRDFVSWLFVDAGPYVFMAILGICVLGVPKGWIPMKGAVIAVICSFVFFAVPSIVRYAASVASSQI